MSRPLAAVTQRQVADIERGEVLDTLDQAWCREFERAGWMMCAVPNRPAAALSLVQRLDPNLIVLSGGGDLPGTGGCQQVARDLTERELVSHAATVGIPVLAVCRGFQHLAQIYGGELGLVDGHVGSVHSIEGSLPSRWGGPPTVASYHRWVVVESSIPSEWTIVARSLDGYVEAIESAVPRILAVLWHPEREPVNLGTLLDEVMGTL